MSQGADNIIMDRAGSYSGGSREIVTEHLGVFSNDGLRTLLLAKKSMTCLLYTSPSPRD